MGVSNLIRVLIIEDQPNIAGDIHAMMAQQPGFVVVGIAQNFTTAIPVIRATQPDLVLLDIMLDGEYTGFDVLAEFAPLPFKVIFLTGYARSDFAIKAIKYGALDYLIKPLREQELQIALQRAVAALPATPEQIQAVRQFYRGAAITHLPLQSTPFVQVVPLEKIMYCHAEEKTMFYIQGKSPVSVNKPLADYESLLPAHQFFRPHRSYLVNSQFIERYYPGGDLILLDGTVIPVSDRRRSALLDFLSPFPATGR